MRLNTLFLTKIYWIAHAMGWDATAAQEILYHIPLLHNYVQLQSFHTPENVMLKGTLLDSHSLLRESGSDVS
jgi:hypothetical protein